MAALVLIVQLALLFCTWLAVRLAIRPLTRLAQAVDHLDPDAPAPELDERGPSEVAYAARAQRAARSYQRVPQGAHATAGGHFP